MLIGTEFPFSVKYHFRNFGMLLLYIARFVPMPLEHLIVKTTSQSSHQNIIFSSQYNVPVLKSIPRTLLTIMCNHTVKAAYCKSSLSLFSVEHIYIIKKLLTTLDITHLILFTMICAIAIQRPHCENNLSIFSLEQNS